MTPQSFCDAYKDRQYKLFTLRNSLSTLESTEVRRGENFYKAGGAQ